MFHTGQTVHVVLLAASTVITALLGSFAGLRGDEPGTRPFAALMVGFTLFSVAHLVGLLTLHSGWRLVWEYVQWTAMASIPVSWLLFAMDYTGYQDLITRRTIGAIAVVPLVTVVLTWTNALHGLVWSEATIVVVDGLAVLQQSFGPWAGLFIVFSYGLLGVGALLLLRLVWLSEYLYTSQSALLFVGIGVPIVANLLTILGMTPIWSPPVDVTPYAFTVTGVASGYALFRADLFDIVPATHRIGHDAAIRGLEDGVLITNADRQIVYCNPAAAALLETEPRAVIGTLVDAIVGDVALTVDTDDALAELERDDAVYEVRSSPIHDRRDRLIGHTLVIQDVTARKRRERRLSDRRAELERLDDLNGVIRGVNRALVAATSRAEIEQAVCERLAESDHYRTVFAGDIPTWNGDADRWTVVAPSSEDGAMPTALRTDAVEPETAQPTIPESLPGTWVVVPLAYGRTIYGALGLEAAPDASVRHGSVTDREREILTELGGLIGHAMNAVENRQLLAADAVVELEFHSTDTGGTLLEAASETGARFEVTGVVPDTASGHLVYVDVIGERPTAVTDALSQGDTREARVVQSPDERADERGLVECTMTGRSLLGTLVDYGCKVREATVTDATAEFVVEVATDADVRTLVERVRHHFPETTLATKRERDWSVEAAGSVPSDDVAELTDRQQEALEAAYRAGYFDWPRESTAEEVAETLDIAGPTLHAHLRKAESSLVAGLFDGDGTRSD